MSFSDGINPDDLTNALKAVDALETFNSLPEDARREFEEWISKARDEQAHRRRIDTLVMAMRAAPRLTPPADGFAASNPQDG